MSESRLKVPLSSNRYQFLSGGGEMGKLTRAKDWSSTSIGSPDKWPHSLRTILGVILNSKFPMFLWWGPELTCFYNDAYRPSLGINGKHPAILGMSAAEAWPEIWDIIKPLIDQVLNEGEATWSEDQLIPIYRNGKLEDVYWTFSYSPVKDETGEISGVLVTCNETTGKIMASRKAEANEKKFRDSVMQAPVAMIVLKGNDFIVEMANKSYLELADKTEENFLNKSLFESLPEVEAVVRPLLESVMQTGMPYYGTEFPVPINRYGSIKKAYFNFVYQPLRENGEITGVIVVANEVTGLVEAKYALGESEKHFRNLVIQSPIPMAIFTGKDYVIDIANTEMLENIWRKEEADVVGKKLLDVFPELKDQKYPQLLEKVFTTGKSHGETESIAHVQGDDGMKTFYLDYEYAPLFDINNEVSGLMVTVNDVTEKVEIRQKLELEEARLRLALEGADLATWDLELDSRKIIHSPRLAEIFGHESSKLLTHPEMQRQIHEADKESIVEKAFDEALKTGVYDYQARVVRPDKSICWIRTQGKLIFDENGKPVRMLGTSKDITQAKISEEASARLAAIVQSSEDAVISKTLEGVVTSWNDSAQRMFGYTAEEMIGQPIAKLFPEDRLDEEPTIIERLKRGERVDHFETQRITKDKRLLDLSLTISPVKDLAGNIIGASKIARDITEQKKIAKLVTESEQRLNIALKAAELGTWELNLLTDEVAYSRRYLEILGYNPSDVVDHKQIMTRIHPDDMDLRNQSIVNALDTGVLDVEMRILVGKNKTVRWIKSKGSVFYNEAGMPLRIMGTTMDITEQKQAFNSVLQSEERFRLLANSMAQLIWTGDAEGNLNYYNQAVYDYSGLTYEELKNEGWLQIVHPDDRDENIKRWMHSIATGEDFILEHRFRMHDGEYRWQLSRALPQRNSTGEIQMWVGTSTDIHAIKESEEQKDFFISMASHELKTPVTSVKGYIQILLSMYGENGDAFLKNSLLTVNKQISTLTTLITDLLDLSKIKAGSLQLNTEYFSINEMIREIKEEIEHTQPDYQINYKHGPESTVFADKGRISQVLINFLTNAIKYSSNSKTIIIKNSIEKDSVVVAVQDSGIGINKNDQGKIFERFYRVEGKNEKTFPGFGIGLFIAAEIMQRHNGRIWVESEPGKGSTFYFSLPLENTSE